MIPTEPGELLRCPACTGKRWRAWAPGLLACEKCHATASLLPVPVEKRERLRCARHCKRGLAYLTTATATRAAVWQCVECHEERPLPFPAVAPRLLTGPRILWRFARKKPSRPQITDPHQGIPPAFL